MKRLHFFVAFAVFFLSFVVVSSVQAQSSATTGGGGWTAGFDSVKTESELPGASVSEIISGFMMWLLVIFGFIAVIAFVISGILYLTAAGNDSQIKMAKTAMTWSIVGVIVALIGYVVLLAADSLLSASAV